MEAAVRGQGRPALRLLYAAYWAVVLVLVFQPTASVASESVRQVRLLAGAIGASGSLTPSVLEFVANVVLFVPMSLLGSALRPSWGALRWTVLGLATSTTIEVLQLVALPTRSATFEDIVANTIGAAVGIGLARAARVIAALRSN